MLKMRGYMEFATMMLIVLMVLSCMLLNTVRLDKEYLPLPHHFFTQ